MCIYPCNASNNSRQVARPRDSLRDAINGTRTWSLGRGLRCWKGSKAQQTCYKLMMVVVSPGRERRQWDMRADLNSSSSSPPRLPPHLLRQSLSLRFQRRRVCRWVEEGQVISVGVSARRPAGSPPSSLWRLAAKASWTAGFGSDGR